jgi:ATP-dependent Clp protease ATP-binding subunit ClpC
VERYLEDPIAEEILRGTIKGGDQVVVTRDGEKLSFKVSGGTPPAKAKGEATKG